MAAKASVKTDRRRVFVVDDHQVFREGLVRILDQESDLAVCGEASDARSTLDRIDAARPALAIIDITLEGTNGIDLVKTLKSRLPDLRLLVLSMHPEFIYAERALRAGAHGYVMKKENSKTLLGAVRQVLAGRTYVSPEINERLLQKVTSPGARTTLEIEDLSGRELEIFELIGHGLGTRQISERLGVSMKTVETHRQHIRQKLNLATTSELVQRAIHWIHRESAGQSS